jgi:hypothetical protein
MTEYERKQQFYEQFNTVVANWAAWSQTPQATFEILQDPWKANAPEVVVRAPDSEGNRARDVLNMLKNRHTGVANAKP